MPAAWLTLRVWTWPVGGRAAGRLIVLGERSETIKNPPWDSGPLQVCSGGYVKWEPTDLRHRPVVVSEFANAERDDDSSSSPSHKSQSNFPDIWRPFKRGMVFSNANDF